MTGDERVLLRALRAAGAVFGADEEAWGRFVRPFSGPVRRGLLHGWAWQAHCGQLPPDGDWRTWLLMAGRGFGKTRAGAEWVSALARREPEARIALVGGSRDEVAKVMVEGPSGLLSVARPDERPAWLPSQGAVTFDSGAQAFVYSAAAPGKLRGPEHHYAWADELAKWARGQETWDNLQIGLRLGPAPRLAVTTTPSPVAVLRTVRRLPGTAETGGRTADNRHLSPAFTRWVTETYGGTRLGRQELDGVLFEDVEGALFPREVLERCRTAPLPASHCSATLSPGPGSHESSTFVGSRGERVIKRVVVGVDPPASADGDACGIVVCGLGADEVAYVLADCSVAGERPEGWARAVRQAAEAWGADRVIAEKNQGGDMVESVLRAAEASLPVRLVSASRGKAARAEPVAAWFETGRARLAGRFPELEDELAGLTAGGGYHGEGSPDRADACVWAMSALIRPAAEPRIMML